MTYNEANRRYGRVLERLESLSKTKPGRGKINLRSSAGWMIDEIEDIRRELAEIVTEM